MGFSRNYAVNRRYLERIVWSQNRLNFISMALNEFHDGERRAYGNTRSTMPSNWISSIAQPIDFEKMICRTESQSSNFTKHSIKRYDLDFLLYFFLEYSVKLGAKFYDIISKKIALICRREIMICHSLHEC